MSNALDGWTDLVFDDVDGYRPQPVFDWENEELRAARLCFQVEEKEGLLGLPRDGVEAVSAVLEHPSLEELTLGIHLAEDLDVTMQPVVDVIAAQVRPSLRSLSLFTWPHDFPFDSELTNTPDLGDLSALWSKLPGLERLIQHANRLQLGEIRLPRLRTLELQFTYTRDQGHGFSTAHWPQLESVALNVGHSQFGSEATTREPAEILERLPRLRNVAIIGYCDDEELIDWLSSSPMLPQLQTLSLPETLEIYTPEQLAAIPGFGHIAIDLGPRLPAPPLRFASDLIRPEYDMKEWRRRF